jgi:hypothetical protein
MRLPTASGPRAAQLAAAYIEVLDGLRRAERALARVLPQASDHPHRQAHISALAGYLVQVATVEMVRKEIATMVAHLEARSGAPEVRP